jgi:ATP-dependent RNA helicase SUPV3L1/SUV3
VRTARTLDRLSAAGRAVLRERLERWLDGQVDRHLRPLKMLAAAATDPAASAGVRAVSAMLADAGGVIPRKSMLSAISHLEQADRQALHGLRVRLGPLDVFVDPLLKPAAQLWRAALLSVRAGERMPELPPAGAATLTAEADSSGAALAYRRVGREWIRIDLADRLASHARKVRSAGGSEPVNAELATSIGLSADAITRLMADVGFMRSGEAWKWRGRRPRGDGPRRSATHAFAELAKLKKT